MMVNDEYKILSIVHILIISLDHGFAYVILTNTNSSNPLFLLGGSLASKEEGSFIGLYFLNQSAVTNAFFRDIS